jgi:peptidyl-prolyl cis-trans isomerase D
MISWMQKHNKYLVWTIWVATIAFIGAGFVGWGSYDFGSKAGSVAKVGDIEIKQAKLNMAYSNLYNRYNQMFQGQFDEKKAKEMGLIQQAFATVATQAKLLNYAKDLGVIVSDEELAHTLESIKGFQENGHFSKNIYKMYLQSQRLSAKTFEENLREELTIAKLLNLLNVKGLPLETETITAALNIADKIKYKTIHPEDINTTLNPNKLKAYWESHKEQYKTPQKLTLAIIWTDTSDVNVTNDELKAFFETNSFQYTSNDGKQLSFEEAKPQLTKDLKLKKSKKRAQKAYIAYKKGKRESSETVTLPVGDKKLSDALWSEIAQKGEGDILKPKVVNDRYATVKIIAVIPPQVMSFDEAKPLVTLQYEEEMKREALDALAEKTLKTIDQSDAPVSDYLSLNHFDNLEGLNQQESLQFLQKLFTSLEEKGMITVANKIVVYAITEQTILPTDANQTQLIQQTVNKTKQSIFESNLIKELDTRYPTEVYMGGLTK